MSWICWLQCFSSTTVRPVDFVPAHTWLSEKARHWPESQREIWPVLWTTSLQTVGRHHPIISETTWARTPSSGPGSDQSQIHAWAMPPKGLTIRCRTKSSKVAQIQKGSSKTPPSLVQHKPSIQARCHKQHNNLWSLLHSVSWLSRLSKCKRSSALLLRSVRRFATDRKSVSDCAWVEVAVTMFAKIIMHSGCVVCSICSSMKPGAKAIEQWIAEESSLISCKLQSNRNTATVFGTISASSIFQVVLKRPKQPQQRTPSTHQEHPTNIGSPLWQQATISKVLWPGKWLWDGCGNDRHQRLGETQLEQDCLHKPQATAVNGP